MKAEMVERRRAEEQLRRALAEVETLTNRLQVENVYLQEEIRQEHNFEEMVGSSPALLAMLQTVETVAHTDATVLLYGETGTGKELIARALHNRSARKDRPLVKVNCGAIAATNRNLEEAMLTQTGGVIEGPKGAATLLKLHPNTLRSRMKKLGSQRPAHDIS